MSSLQSQIDSIFDDAIKKAKPEHDALTLVTLCDIVLGEDATDRSDWALIKAVGMLQRRNGLQDETIQNFARNNMALTAEANQLTRANAELHRQLDVARCWAKRWKAYAKGWHTWGDK